MAAVRRLASDELPPPAPEPVADVTPAGAARVAAEVAVLSGVSPRRLAVVMPPAAGEAFGSWVERFAADQQMPAGLAALALGLPVREQRGDVRPLFYGIALTPVAQARLAAATGLRPDLLAAMQLARFSKTALDFSALNLADERSVQALVQREWALFHASRACPSCLAEGGGAWPLWWRLGAAAVCPVHRVLLVDVCPACGVRLRRGYTGRPRGLSRVALADPLLCGNHTPTGRCTQRLADIVATPVPASLVAAQRRVLAAAHGQPEPIAGEPVSAAAWFAALRYTAALVRFAATPGDVAAALGEVPDAVAAFTVERDTRESAKAGAPAALRTMPATAALAAALLALTDPLLTAPDQVAAAARFRPLVVAAVRRRRAEQHDPLRALPPPSMLATVLTEVTPPPSRVAGAAAAANASAPTDLRFQHIPHLIAVGDYADLVAVHLPHAAPAKGRRLAALALARLAGARSWGEAAAKLGMDTRQAVVVADRAVRRVRHPDAFWTAVAAVAQRMTRRGLVDYAARRVALTGLVEAPHAVLRPVCARLNAPVTRERRGHAAAWVWQELTGGDVNEAPAYAGWQAVAESLREGYRRFLRWLPALAAEALRAWGTGLLAVKRAV